MPEFTQTRIISLGGNSGNEPETSLPGVIRTKKFIVIAAGEELVLIHGPVTEYPYHAGLVKAYCELNDVPSGWVKKPDVYEIHDDSYRVMGGGWLEENHRDKQLGFYGSSSAYGGFDAADIKYIYKLQPASDFVLVFGD